MRLTEYDRKTLSTFARLATGSQSRPSGISDSDCAGERQLFQFVRDHVQALKVAVANYNAGVSVNSLIEWARIADVLSDEIPDQEAFEERLSDARRSY